MIKTILAALGSATLTTFIVLTFLLTFGSGAEKLNEPGLPWHFAAFAIVIFGGFVFSIVVTTRVLWRQLNPTPRTTPIEPDAKQRNRRTQYTGKMKFYNPVKGFGFATLKDGRDVFIHKSKLRYSRDLPSLKTGSDVSMNLIEEDRGLAGRQIRILQEEE